MIGMLSTAARGLLPPIDRSAFGDGFRLMTPLAAPIAVWGLVTGAVMVNAGLTVPVALLISLTVYAGSAQLATLPLLVAGSPLPVVWATSLVVNLRFVIFAAASRRAFMHLPWQQRLLAGYLNGDLGFALFTQRFSGSAEHGSPEQWGYFYGLNSLNWLAWQASSVVGILLGNVVPEAWGLGLASYLALLAVLIPMVKGLPAVAGTMVAAVVAVATYRFPMRSGLLVAVVAGVTIAMVTDSWRSRVLAATP